LTGARRGGLGPAPRGAAAPSSPAFAAVLTFPAMTGAAASHPRGADAWPHGRGSRAWVVSLLAVHLLGPGGAAVPPPTEPLVDAAALQGEPAAAAAEGPPPAPLPPPGEMARCKELIDAGLYEAARSRLQPIVEQHPGWARATALLALTYYRQNRFEAAKPLFARALAADPEELAILPFYGWSLYSLGELEAAEDTFASLLTRMPEYTVTHYALGLIHRERDETAAARERFAATARLAAAQRDPVMEGRARARLGDLHLAKGDLDAAKRELVLAIELFPDEAEAIFALSRVLQRLGDEAGAEEARRKFEEAQARDRSGTDRLPE
jgi:tetratricopeptide (TPR) repeat protein